MAIASTTLEKQILDVIEESILGLGYEIVRIKIFDSAKRQTLQIMIDRADNKLTKIEDCEKVSRHLSVLLDVEDIIKDRYDLEISSPGIDRPLTRFKDYKNFAGNIAKLEFNNKILDARRFKAFIIAVNEETNKIKIGKELERNSDFTKMEQNIIEVDFADIIKAKLILDDELINFTNKLYKD